MKKAIPFPLLLAAMLAAVFAAVFVACGPSGTSRQADIPSVDELAADPARLKELRRQCKTDRSQLGDMLCNRVAEATRKQFYGDGNTPYTPPKTPPKF